MDVVFTGTLFVDDSNGDNRFQEGETFGALGEEPRKSAAQARKDVESVLGQNLTQILDLHAAEDFYWDYRILEEGRGRLGDRPDDVTREGVLKFRDRMMGNARKAGLHDPALPDKVGRLFLERTNPYSRFWSVKAKQAKEAALSSDVSQMLAVYQDLDFFPSADNVNKAIEIEDVRYDLAESIVRVYLQKTSFEKIPLTYDKREKISEAIRQMDDVLVLEKKYGFELTESQRGILDQRGSYLHTLEVEDYLDQLQSKVGSWSEEGKEIQELDQDHACFLIGGALEVIRQAPAGTIDVPDFVSRARQFLKIARRPGILINEQRKNARCVQSLKREIRLPLKGLKD